MGESMAGNKLYNNRRWRAKRAALLREHPLCASCLAQGKYTPATVADHVIPHRNDPDLFWNGKLQALCDTCHNSAKKIEEAGGVAPGCDKNGLPLDNKHPWGG
jgi:5-methylcytosine-specific restriction enzyme A